METPTPYIVNGQRVKPRVESFRLKPKRVRYRFTRRTSGLADSVQRFKRGK